jgi:hypothetical protein
MTSMFRNPGPFAGLRGRAHVSLWSPVYKMSPTNTRRLPQGDLTERQAEVLVRFHQLAQEQGVEPTAAELAHSLGTHSHSSRALFGPLLRKGYLRKVPRAARSVRLTPAGVIWLLERQSGTPAPVLPLPAQPEFVFPGSIIQLPLFSDPSFAPNQWEPALASG